MVEITTQRLRLRPATPADLEPLHAILTHPVAMRFWSTTPHETIEKTAAWLQSMIDIPPSEGEDFMVEHEGRLIGKSGLFRFPEIGFIFHPDYWGRGFAAEALGAVLDRGFAVHRLDRVTADVDPRNAPSLKLLARLGFTETGREERTYQIAGEWCDSVYLELTPGRWRAVAVEKPGH